METPWGSADHVERVCPGVQAVSTSGHGGYAVMPEVVAKWPQALRDFVPFAGPGWYEEDCDWSVVVAAMPEHFGIVKQAAAVKMIRMMTTRRMSPPTDHDFKYEPLVRWLASDEAKPLVTRVDEWLEANARAGRYESSSAGTGGAGWRLHWAPFRFQAFGNDLPGLVTFHLNYPGGTDVMCPTRDELLALYGVVQVGGRQRLALVDAGEGELIARTPEAFCEVAYTLGWRPNPMDRSYSSPGNQESARKFLSLI